LNHIIKGRKGIGKFAGLVLASEMELITQAEKKLVSSFPRRLSWRLFKISEKFRSRLRLLHPLRWTPKERHHSAESEIPIRCSTNLLDWKRCGSAFDSLPQWATNEITRARGAWAPDISFFNGKFHLYYALSSFGVNESAIGLAVNDTLDQSSPRYQWVDQGLVVRSRPGADDFNAIDPNLVIEDARNVWLCWGSFWGGIKMRRIDPRTGKLSATDTNLYSLASRPRLHAHQTPPVEDAIEAPTSGGTAATGICSRLTISAVAARTAPTKSKWGAREKSPDLTWIATENF
jgi:hypothetical protein